MRILLFSLLVLVSSQITACAVFHGVKQALGDEPNPEREEASAKIWSAQEKSRQDRQDEAIAYWQSRSPEQLQAAQFQEQQNLNNYYQQENLNNQQRMMNMQMLNAIQNSRGTTCYRTAVGANCF